MLAPQRVPCHRAGHILFILTHELLAVDLLTVIDVRMTRQELSLLWPLLLLSFTFLLWVSCKVLCECGPLNLLGPRSVEHVGWILLQSTLAKPQLVSTNCIKLRIQNSLDWTVTLRGQRDRRLAGDSHAYVSERGAW